MCELGQEVCERLLLRRDSKTALCFWEILSNRALEVAVQQSVETKQSGYGAKPSGSDTDGGQAMMDWNGAPHTLLLDDGVCRSVRTGTDCRGLDVADRQAQRSCWSSAGGSM